MFSRHVFVQAGPLDYHSKFSYAMSGQKYEQILCCLCTLELGEKLRKQDIKLLTLNFQKLYNASEKLSLDDFLLLLRGRLCF